jgi:UDP-3-O-[3-hydroxymyristoyl] glucosamine N-acyltransferase
MLNTPVKGCSGKGGQSLGALRGLICLLKLVWHTRRARIKGIFMKLVELAKKTASTIEQGPHDVDITSTAGLDIAGEGDITFLANPKYVFQAKDTRASAIFLNENVDIDRDDIAVLRAKDSYLAYTRAMRLFFPDSEIKPFVHPTAVIEASASIADKVEIHASVVIGANCSIAAGVRLMPNVTIYDGVMIGENTAIHSGVSIRENCEIGRNCIIHNNTTIGADGFGFAKDEQKRWLKIPQAGRVVVEDDVEIGANTAIDCASVGETRIKRGTKIDNLVQVGHSCSIDEDTLVCAQTGLAGSSHIGKRVILAGQVGIAGHLTVGDDAIITAQAAAAHDVPPGTMIGGPNLDNRLWIRVVSALKRLPDTMRIIRSLEKRIERLERDETNG